jgi:starch synthase (maltosyl-transferring)
MGTTDRFQPIAIERVGPSVDGGEHPVKRVIGDVLRCRAEVFKDGHDVIAVALLHRGPGDDVFRETPMSFVQPGLDEWAAEIALDRIGAWSFAIEAWVDAYATWRDATKKKFDAGSSLEIEGLEGETIVRAAIDRCREGATTWGRSWTREDGAMRDVAEATLLRARRAKTTRERAMILVHDDVARFLTLWGERVLRSRSTRAWPVWVDRKEARFAAWYELFPRSEGAASGRSGTFADAAKRLPAIAAMGFDVVYLPPIHPIGLQFRKGKNNAVEARPSDPGSPWAIGSEGGGHTAIDPALGTIDDFAKFVRAARKLGMEVALDFAIQCSPDHPWVREHPEWFVHRVDGSIAYAENPPKKYQDIYPLAFWGLHRDALWQELRAVVMFWIGHGVRAFRVDNPHTKPLAFWRWLIETVQSDFPDVIFLAEAFTRPSPMKALAKIGFTESYTYFTWRTTKRELAEYVTELTRSSMTEYYRANFWPNTPDILHAFLQKGGRPAFEIRLVLAACLSSLYGIYSGYELCENEPLREGSEEYLHSEKYQFKPRDWGRADSLAPLVTKLNRARRENPALQLYDNVVLHESDDDHVLVWSKATSDRSNVVICAVNLDPRQTRSAWVKLDVAAIGVGEDEQFDVEDALTGDRWPWKGGRAWVQLDPSKRAAHVFVLRKRIRHDQRVHPSGA